MKSYPTYKKRSRRCILTKVNFALQSALICATLILILQNVRAPSTMDQGQTQADKETARPALDLSQVLSEHPQPWYVFVYDPVGSRGKMPEAEALTGFRMNHQRFTLTTHRLYGLDKAKALDYRLMRPVRPDDGDILQLAVRVTADQERAKHIQAHPLPAKCTINAGVDDDRTLNETIFLRHDSDVTLLTKPIQAKATKNSHAEVTVNCAQQAEALVQALTFDIEIRQSNQRLSSIGNEQLRKPGFDRESRFPPAPPAQTPRLNVTSWSPRGSI